MMTLSRGIQSQVLIRAAGGDVPGGIPAAVPQGPGGLRHRGRTHAGCNRGARADRFAARSAPFSHLLQPHHQTLSGLPGILRHGRCDLADRRLLQTRCTRLGRAQTDPLSAGSGRRRQVVHRRAPEAAHGAQAGLCVKRLSGQRIPLGLFAPEEYGDVLEAEYGIPRRYLHGIMSPWAIKRLQEFGGDISQFRVSRIQPSVLRQTAIAKTEPGDENNQDISSLVGKVDIRKLDKFAQDDPDAYSYSGGLCLANQGMLEFVEMFKAPIKMLHPLLTATQEGNFKGTEGFSAIPFNGIILAHSNESEWQSFRNNRHNEAFLDRIYIVKVPYCLQVSEEVKIYEKLLRNSALSEAPCAPGTLEMMAQFSVLSRLKEPENSSIYLQDARVRRREPQRYRPQGQVVPGIPRLRGSGRRHDRNLHAFRVQDFVDGIQLRPDRGGGQSGAPDVRARAAHRPRRFSGRDQAQIPGVHQRLSGAALRRIHRQGDPDGLSRVLLGVRSEHLRPLRDLCRLLDPGRGLPRSGHR